MPQLPGANVFLSVAPGWRARWLLRHGPWKRGGGWEKRSVSLLDREQPRAGVNLAAPRGHFPSSDSAGLCSSLLSPPAPSSSSGQPLHTSHGQQMTCPKAHCWKPLLQSREAPGSLFAQGDSNQGEKKAWKKLRIRQFGMPAPPKFSEVFLAPSFELKETAV